jgi:hypothetical protein
VRQSIFRAWLGRALKSHLKLLKSDLVVPGGESKLKRRPLHAVTDVVHGWRSATKQNNSSLDKLMMKISTAILYRFVHVRTGALAAVAAAALLSTPALAFDNDNDGDDFKFDLIRSKGLDPFPSVATDAHGKVKIESVGPVEIMKVKSGNWRPTPISTCS